MNNPSNLYPEEKLRTQSTESYPPMEELPLKPLPPQNPIQSSPANAIAAQPQQPVPLEEGKSSVSVTRYEEADKNIFFIRKLNQFLYWFLTVLEVTLAIEFFLLLIGASENNPFASFMYALTVIPLYPFNDIVQPTKLGSGGAVIEWSILIAMAVYFLFFFALRRFLQILTSDTEESGE
jgi:hypothetical protein